MITIDDQGHIQYLRKLLDPENLRKAERSAIKATQARTATFIHRQTTQIYNVAQRAIAARLKVGVSNDGSQAWLRWSGTRIGLINFAAQFKKIGVRPGRWGNTRLGATSRTYKNKGRELAIGGFIAEGANGNVQIFKRKNLKDNSRTPTRAMTGPSIPQMISNPEVLAGADRFVADEYPKQLLNRLKFFYEKQQ